MIYRDYIPGTTASSQETIPAGYDYWLPHWRLENGKLIKDKPEPKKEVINEASSKVEESNSFFQCNKCEFKTENEAGIKRHVTVKHKG